MPNRNVILSVLRIRNAILSVLLAAVMVLLPFEIGCSSAQAGTVAQSTANVISNVLKLAQADVPALEQTGVISAAEATAVGNFLAGASSISSQLSACVAGAVSAGSKKAGFLACFNTFVGGITPAELALLRVINPKAQAKVTEWVAVITIGVNTVLALTGGAPVAVPTAPAAGVSPTAAQLLPLAIRAGVTPEQFHLALRITNGL